MSSEKEKYWPKTKKTDRCIEMVINRNHIVSAVEQYLRSISVINDRENVSNIQFQDLFGSSDIELVPIRVYFSKPEGGAKT
jgi:uncharacterized protein YjaZ